MTTMLHSSPVYSSPATPHTTRKFSTGSYSHSDAYSYTPMNSSPLAGGSSPAGPSSSPLQRAQARRKSQYKSKSRTASSSYAQSSSPTVSMSMSLSSDTGSILRDKFRNSCLKRAVDARKRIVKNKRKMEPMCSSDGFEVDESMDVENASEDEDDFNDEVLRRVMLNENRKLRHKYRLSYYDACGDSFDPDLEDVEEWENELQEGTHAPSSSQAQSSQAPLIPEELENAELEAYAEEWERQAALAEFDNIPVEDLFDLDEDDFVFESKEKDAISTCRDDDMVL